MLKLMLLLLMISFIAKKLFNNYKTSYKAKKSSTYCNNDAPSAQNLIQCKHCGIYTPLTSAISYKNNFFCCKEHVS